MAGLLIAGSHGVPTEAPLESFVATDYERFDGLEDLSATPTVDLIGSPRKPGGYPDEVAIPSAIPGKVGSVGATPLPVADCIKRNEDRQTAYATTLTTQFSGGPGGAAPGLDQSLYLQSVVDNPVPPDALAYMFA